MNSTYVSSDNLEVLGLLTTASVSTVVMRKSEVNKTSTQILTQPVQWGFTVTQAFDAPCSVGTGAWHGFGRHAACVSLEALHMLTACTQHT